MMAIRRRGGRAAWTMVLLAGLLAAPSWAQKMYRCGSNYQDRPCTGQDSRVISSSGAGQATQGATAVDPACAQRAAEAQKIAWVRETGKTEAEQSAARPDQRALITEVYRRRGSSLEIRDALQAECVAEKERAAQAAAMVESALRQQGGAAPAGSRAAR